MQIEVIVSLAIGLWIALLVPVISLCRVGRRADEVMDTALASARAAGGDQAMTVSRSSERPLRSLSLNRAACLLGVSPPTLLDWESRYGFPTSTLSEPRYSEAEVLALRDCLEKGHSIAASVSLARERRRAAAVSRLHDHRDGELAS
jgi:hypothetical protein